MSEIGSLAWAQRSKGSLSDDETRRYTIDLARQVVKRDAAEIAKRHDRLRHFDIDKLAPPDSSLAKTAMDYARESYSVDLMNHCYRTFYWGALLAAADGQRLKDPEVLFMAAALHDLGMTDRHFGSQAGCQCFAVEGALCAHDWLRQQKTDTGRFESVPEAIALHVNPAVSDTHGETAVYLHAGAHCDVFSTRADEVPVPTSKRILADFPIGNAAQEIMQFTLRNAQARPKSRSAVQLSLLRGTGLQLFAWANR